jgi:hypothetical protein
LSGFQRCRERRWRRLVEEREPLQAREIRPCEGDGGDAEPETGAAPKVSIARAGSARSSEMRAVLPPNRRVRDSRRENSTRTRSDG